MKKLLGFGLLMLLACESGVEINLECLLKHTSEVLKMESTLLGEKEQVIVNLTWRWLYQKPSIDAVIIERSLNDSTHYTPIDTLPVDTIMTYTDNDSMLMPNSVVFYRLNSLYGKATETFKVVEVNTPPAQDFYQPQTDTIGNDTLTITFGKLENFSNYNLSIYRVLSNQIDSLFSIPIESLLVMLTSPLFDTTITDTTITVYLSDSIFPDTAVYTVKVSSSKIFELITDTSIGLRPFFKQ